MPKHTATFIIFLNSGIHFLNWWYIDILTLYSDVARGTGIPQKLLLLLFEAVVAQEVEQVIYLLEGWWFDLLLLQAACWSVLEQDTEPRIAPDGKANVSNEQIGTMCCSPCCQRHIHPFTPLTILQYLRWTFCTALINVMLSVTLFPCTAVELVCC